MKQPTSIIVRTSPDALVKIYDETRDEVIYIDNTDDDNQTAPVILSAGSKYYIDITIFQ